MPFNLTNFRIEGLYGNRSIEIPFHDNQLILVGENGTGKSTVTNFLFFFLSHQWSRLSQYVFQTITMTYSKNGETKQLHLEQSDLVAGGANLSARSKRLMDAPIRFQRQIDELLSRYSVVEILNEPVLLDSLVEAGLPRSYIREFLELYVVRDLDTKQITERRNRLRKIDQELSAAIEAQILYLPTYRRIERELEYIFPGLTIDDLQRQRQRTKQNSEHYLELVEFGMDDVKRTIESTMSRLSAALRNGLNELTGTYLREVVRREYREVNVAQLLHLGDESITAVLDRVGENLLSNDDKARLRQIISKVSTGEPVDNEDKVILHFLIRLIGLHEQQQRSESSVQEFVAVCNNYLIGKRLAYDSRQFEIHIQQTGRRQKNRPSTIQLSHLSSGEKQIVSLFAHVYLSQRPSFFVIIDEPELSLSVKWQKRFLPDILASKRCEGLVAVTHSPFIFDNSLKAYTHGIEEFWVRGK